MSLALSVGLAMLSLFTLMGMAIAFLVITISKVIALLGPHNMEQL